MLVEERAINEVVPYEGNPRRNDAAVDAVAASIREYGFRQPVVVDAAGTIVVGHTRWKAAKQIGLETVPVHVADELSPEQARAYRLADNQTASIAAWDDDLLVAEIAHLRAVDYDLDSIGFSPDELDVLLAPAGTAGLVDADEIPEPPDDPVTQVGDIWKLGRHRVICGDATDEATVSRVLDGTAPFIMVTDPPYGVEYDPEWRKRAWVSQSDHMGVVTNDDQADWTAAYRLFPGDVAYVWHAGRFGSIIAGNLESVGFDIRAQIIWRKPRFALSRGHYHWQHEPCWYAVREGATAKWQGDRSQSTVWDVSNALESDDAKTTHGTQKPVECMARPIRNHGGRDDDVFDPFLGSGTTLIAAEQLGRRCLGVEIDPAYCDVVVERWQNFTGGARERVER